MVLVLNIFLEVGMFDGMTKTVKDKNIISNNKKMFLYLPKHPTYSGNKFSKSVHTHTGDQVPYKYPYGHYYRVVDHFTSSSPNASSVKKASSISSVTVPSCLMANFFIFFGSMNCVILIIPLSLLAYIVIGYLESNQASIVLSGSSTTLPRLVIRTFFFGMGLPALTLLQSSSI